MSKQNEEGNWFTEEGSKGRDMEEVIKGFAARLSRAHDERIDMSSSVSGYVAGLEVALHQIRDIVNDRDREGVLDFINGAICGLEELKEGFRNSGMIEDIKLHKDSDLN